MIYLELVFPPINTPVHIAKFYLTASVFCIVQAERLCDSVTTFLVIYLFKTLFINNKVLKYHINLATFALSSLFLQF